MSANGKKCIIELYDFFKKKPYWNEIKKHLNNIEIDEELFTIIGVDGKTSIHCQAAAFIKIKELSKFKHKHAIEILSPILNKYKILFFSIASNGKTTEYSNINSLWVETNKYKW